MSHTRLRDFHNFFNHGIYRSLLVLTVADKRLIAGYLSVN